MSNADALRCATLWCAQYSGLANQLGTVAEGKIADLILVSGNPLERISVLDNIQIVITNGRLFYTKDLRSSNRSNDGLHQD
jgi:imidazolonepropionase-like amidohydrolase